MALRATILPTLLKFCVRFNQDHEHTDMSSAEISNLVGKRSIFTDS